MDGKLIVFEGGDGTGKSTQADLLKRYYESQGKDVIMIREPGGTPIGEQIRNILLDNGNTSMDNMTEALLYLASRVQLVNEVIKPALADDKIVICDRFILSSLVYQGIARGIGVDKIKQLHDIALGDLEINHTFVLSIEYIIGIERKLEQKSLDRLESAGSDFHRRVNEGYLDVAKFNSSGELHIIDANRPIGTIRKEIVDILTKEE